MLLKERINALRNLGEWLSSLDDSQLDSLSQRAAQENPWFVREHIEIALSSLAEQLTLTSLQKWLDGYSFPSTGSIRTIGLVLAGNIPLVGFHDLLCVLITGHKALIKTSTKDSLLPTHLLKELISIEPRFQEQIEITDQLKNFDAIIATGSDNSSRYFDYYFGKYPHIIRKNRSSCAILSGFETSHDLEALGLDVFTYYGLGCRNVSKLFVPVGYEFNALFESWQKYENLLHHHKYCNNYDYQKAILLVNKVEHYDNGFVLLNYNEKLVSPISVLFYEVYDSEENLKQLLSNSSEKIQCIVGNHNLANVPFGRAQHPGVNDYADQVDTIQFLLSLN